MNSEQNKQVVRRFVDEYQTAGNESAFDELLHPDFVNHSAAPGMSAGTDGVRQIFDMFRAAFPDFRATVLDQVAEGDKVVTRKVFHGTHDGGFMGIPATGREIEIVVIDILRIRDGKLAEHWGVFDQMGLMQQLGTLPEPAAAG
jgi:steroid delta-isomerase-like uncharacterized protein